jgi:hypothetical protein
MKYPCYHYLTQSETRYKIRTAVRIPVFAPSVYWSLNSKVLWKSELKVKRASISLCNFCLKEWTTIQQATSKIVISDARNTASGLHNVPCFYCPVVTKFQGLRRTD